MHPSSNPSASSSSSAGNNVVAGSTMTSRRATSKNGGSNAQKQSIASSSASSSSKWKLVRPWQPPSSSARSAEATLEDGNGELQQQQHNDNSDEERDDADNDEYDEADQVDDSASSAVLAASSSRLKKMHLEVVDVSSTSVSLSVFGQASQEHSSTHQHLDTSLGSTSSMTNQTTATRRSRAASTSSERILSNPPEPPNISIKLNSAAWPHVFHTDASFFDTDSSKPSTDDQGLSSSILVWGLSPGQNYHIELGVFEDGEDDEDDAGEPEDLSEVSDTEESLRAAASVRTLDATEPDVPPPPYSSHDPSSGPASHNDAEVSLRSMLDKLRVTAKQKESALQSSISSMRRANDKMTREDQRHRQRIHMLEDSTSRLREVAADEDAEHETIQEQIGELEETETLTVTRLERRKSQLEDSEKLFKEEADKEDAELTNLKERLDKAAEREEEVLAKKMKLERELLPTYNIQLATLEADLRRLVDDHRRRFPYQHHVSPHAYSTHLSHPNSGIGHVHAPQNNVRGGRERLQARAVQHQQAQQQQQQQQQQQHHHQQQQAHSHGPQTTPPIDQRNASAGTRQSESGSKLSKATPSGSVTAADNVPDRMNRGGNGPDGEEHRNTSLSFDDKVGVDGLTSGPVLGGGDQETGRRASTTTSASTGARTGSRFAWSSPNSWASKVAGGVRGGNGKGVGGSGSVEASKDG